MITTWIFFLIVNFANSKHFEYFETNLVAEKLDSDAENELNLLKELSYRLDIVDCSANKPHANADIRHTARVHYNNFKKDFKCCIEESTPPHDIIPHRGIIAISSFQNKNGSYLPEQIEYYNISCPREGKIMRMSTDLQDRVQVGDKMVCLDYVRLENPEKLTFNEYCGNESASARYPPFKNLLVTFRSGNSIEKTGFNMLIVCKSSVATNQMTCLQANNEVTVNDYLSSKQNMKDYTYSHTETIPQGTLEKLSDFYMDRHFNNLNNPIYAYDGILDLAVTSEKSCDSILVSVAQAVVDVFPESMVLRARFNALQNEQLIN